MKKKKINSKEVLNNAMKKPGREKVSFTFDRQLYQKFNDKCKEEGVACSRVLEELMKEFLQGFR